MNTKDFYPTNFNPSDWLKSENKASSAAAPSSSGVASPTSREDDATRVKALIEALQASHVDLTASYDNWLHVGFALANTLGENGRTFFHEISALSPNDAADVELFVVVLLYGNSRPCDLISSKGGGTTPLGGCLQPPLPVKRSWCCYK